MAQEYCYISKTAVRMASWNCSVGPFSLNRTTQLTVEGRNCLWSDPVSKEHYVSLSILSIVFSIGYTAYFSTAKCIEAVCINRLFRNGILKEKHAEAIGIHIRFIDLK